MSVDENKIVQKMVAEIADSNEKFMDAHSKDMENFKRIVPVLLEKGIDNVNLVNVLVLLALDIEALSILLKNIKNKTNLICEVVYSKLVAESFCFNDSCFLVCLSKYPWRVDACDNCHDSKLSFHLLRDSCSPDDVCILVK